MRSVVSAQALHWWLAGQVAWYYSITSSAIAAISSHPNSSRHRAHEQQASLAHSASCSGVWLAQIRVVDSQLHTASDPLTAISVVVSPVLQVVADKSMGSKSLFQVIILSVLPSRCT